MERRTIYKNAIRRFFRKIKLTVDNLHDEIINSSQYLENKLLTTAKFSYEKDYVSACGVENGLEFQLPMSGAVLREWAHLLQNCMEGYTIPIKKRTTTIFGVFKEDQLYYGVEISDGEIMQMSGKYNEDVPEYDSQVIIDWTEKYFGHLIVACN